jgi:pimeloyl-ACP methyl ester carboxylesterase
MLYASDRARLVPYLVHRASAGDLAPFAEQALVSSRAMRSALRLGLLMSVVCSEDVPRIAEADIERETAGTLLGDSRVRQQSAACATWPRARVSAEDVAPVAATTPVLLVSGRYDPVTPPRWGAEAARHLPNALHLVVEAAHVPRHPCLDALHVAFLRAGSARGLDARCTRDITLPPFFVPGR